MATCTSGDGRRGRGLRLSPGGGRCWAPPVPLRGGSKRPVAAAGARGERQPWLCRSPQLQPRFDGSCTSLKTDPKCYFIIYRGNKCLFFKAILLNVYMYRQIRKRCECLVTKQCSPGAGESPGALAIARSCHDCNIPAEGPHQVPFPYRHRSADACVTPPTPPPSLSKLLLSESEGSFSV